MKSNDLQQRKITKGLIIIVILISLVMLARHFSTRWKQESSDSTARLFFDAVDNKNYRVIQRIVESENSDELSQLIDNKQDRSRCKVNHSYGPTSVVGEVSDEEINYSYIFTCNTIDNSSYCLYIDDILVVNDGEKWVVRKWGDIHVGYSLSDC